MTVHEFGDSKNPIIHTQDMRHEELLGVYPDKWCALVKEICSR